jgi:DNA-binding NarL/FixJ family response regulator
MIRVLFADEFELMRRLVRTYIGKTPDIEVVGVCGFPGEVIAFLDKVAFDVLVISQGMLTPECLRLLRQSPSIKVIVTSLYQNEMLMEDILKLGAAALVLKPDFHPHLLAAIRAVHQNEMYFSVGNEAM